MGMYDQHSKQLVVSDQIAFDNRKAVERVSLFDTAGEKIDLKSPSALAQDTAFTSRFGTIVAAQVVGDGVTNDTAALQAAIDSLPDAGGAVIVPPKTMIVQGVVLPEHVWILAYGATFKAPSSPSASMFTTAVAAGFNGGGIIGAELDGRDATQKGIDFSNITEVDTFLVDGCYLHHFSTAWQGSNTGDRRPSIRNSRIWYNTIGVESQEHVDLVSCDIRLNTTGLTGRLNDFTAVNCRFNYNTSGVKPLSGQYISGSLFVGCSFFKNTAVGLEITSNNTVSGCQFVGNNAAADVMLKLNGECNVVTGNQFGLGSAATSSASCCISLATSSTRRSTIQGNSFNIASGCAILAVAGVRDIAVVGNTAQLQGVKFWVVNGADVQVVTISGNTLTVALSAISSGGVIESYPDHVIIGNVVRADSVGSTGNALSGNVAGSLIANNYFNGFTTNVSISNGNAAYWSNNVGYITSNNGTATVANGTTSITVSHGLSRTPNTSDILVTPTNSMGSATKFYVTNIGATTFDIVVNTDPGATTATFAWFANYILA